MAPPDLRGFLQVGLDILTTSINPTTKKILAQLGNAVGKTVDTDNAEWWQQYGIASRPPKPQPGKQAAQGVVLRKGDHDIVIASQDLRGLELYGSLDFGEVCIYSAGDDGNGQARSLYKKDGSISHYTRKGNTPDGGGMLMQLDAQAGVARVLNDKGYGLVVDQDGVKLTATNSTLVLNGEGTAKLIAKQKLTVDGSTIMLGSKAEPALNAALAGPTGLAGVASAKVFIQTVP